MQSHGFHRRTHRGAGCEPVIDENDGQLAEVARRTVPTVFALAPFELRLLVARDFIDRSFRDPVPTDDVVVEHPHEVLTADGPIGSFVTTFRGSGSGSDK